MHSERVALSSEVHSVHIQVAASLGKHRALGILPNEEVADPFARLCIVGVRDVILGKW